jgi:Zn-dependent membrane protease YugP
MDGGMHGLIESLMVQLLNDKNCLGMLVENNFDHFKNCNHCSDATGKEIASALLTQNKLT